MTIPIQILNKKIPFRDPEYHSGIQKWILKRKRWNQPVATAEAAAPSGPGETSLVWFHRFPIIAPSRIRIRKNSGERVFAADFLGKTTFPE